MTVFRISPTWAIENNENYNPLSFLFPFKKNKIKRLTLSSNVRDSATHFFPFSYSSVSPIIQRVSSPSMILIPSSADPNMLPECPRRESGFNSFLPQAYVTQLSHACFIIWGDEKGQQVKGLFCLMSRYFSGQHQPLREFLKCLTSKYRPTLLWSLLTPEQLYNCFIKLQCYLHIE